MPQAELQQPLPGARTWASFTLPWLLSSAAHFALLLILALRVHWLPRDADLSPAGDDSLVVTIGSSRGASSEEVVTSEIPASLPSPTEAPSKYYDDEPVTLTSAREVPSATGRTPSLAALLDEKPAVSPSDTLPTADEAHGGRPAGVETARSLTGQPAGSRHLRGGTARTSVFGAVGEGRKFAYVFDRSGSMDGHGGAPLRSAKAELIASLNDLKSTHQFQIVFYNEHPRAFNPTGVQGRLVFGTDQNKNLAQKFVGSITADGATRHEEALEMALKMVPDVVFFLTDADEPRMTSAQLARIARLNHGTIIHTIEFGYGPQGDLDNFLVKLARHGGGTHVYVNVAQLPGAVR